MEILYVKTYYLQHYQLQSRPNNVNLRRSNLITTPRNRLTNDEHQFDIKISNYINSLENNLKNIDKIKGLKTTLKRTYLNNYKI